MCFGEEEELQFCERSVLDILLGEKQEIDEIGLRFYRVESLKTYGVLCFQRVEKGGLFSATVAALFGLDAVV